MTSITAFLVLAIVYYIGEFVSTKTKAWIPSVFVIASLFLVGYWTFFPKDIVALAGMGLQEPALLGRSQAATQAAVQATAADAAALFLRAHAPQPHRALRRSIGTR